MIALERDDRLGGNPSNRRGGIVVGRAAQDQPLSRRVVALDKIAGHDRAHAVAKQNYRHPRIFLFDLDHQLIKIVDALLPALMLVEIAQLLRTGRGFAVRGDRWSPRQSPAWPSPARRRHTATDVPPCHARSER